MEKILTSFKIFYKMLSLYTVIFNVLLDYTLNPFKQHSNLSTEEDEIHRDEEIQK